MVVIRVHLWLIFILGRVGSDVFIKPDVNPCVVAFGEIAQRFDSNMRRRAGCLAWA